MNRLIGEFLVERGVITSEQCRRGIEVQKGNGDYFCDTIIKLGFAKSRNVLKILSEHINIQYVDLKKEVIDEKVLEKVPVRLALHYKLMPYKYTKNKIMVALADPLDTHKLDDLRLLLNSDIAAVLSYEEDILESIQKYYGVGAQILEEIMTQQEVEEKVKGNISETQDLESAADEASIIKFVNHLFTQAVEERVTDIHLEPFENELKVRFRIDGFLYEVPVPDSIQLFHPAIVSRIKIMSHLDIAEHRYPQDGRMKIRIKGRELDLRVSIIPSCYGESVQIRILSAESFLRLGNLGLFEDDFEKIETLISKPHGVIFVTGPTGSGKSTTLYACLSKKNLPDTKIVTIEDPVEYQVRGITQMQIHPKIGLNFAEGLRFLLRHDPDIIMVGEVRDVLTAEITIRSAMTGHLVFSTLHTNDAANAPTRLIDMEIEPFLVASSLEGIIAQRLVRVLCPYCKKKSSVSSKIFQEEGIDIKKDTVEVFEGKKCENCRFTGYKGRTAIFEIIIVDDEMRNLIDKKVTSQTIKEKAFKSGMRTLRQDGLRKVLKGITTLSEVVRVT